MEDDAIRILLVEDNDDNREIYATILRHHGYDVTEATDGEEALSLARELRPPVILLDISIPGVDGWQVADRLKRDEETRGAAIIAITAHALPEDRERADDLGCESYLSKPVRPGRVLEEVRKYAGPPGEEPHRESTPG